MVAMTLGVQSVAQAAEADHGLLNDRLTASLGTFLLSTHTQVRLDGSAGNAGTVVDLQRDLGASDKNRFRLDATWRFAPHHKIRTMYFDTRQSRSVNISRDLAIGDTVYPASAQLSVKSSTTVMELAYEYAFVKKDDVELSASAGVHSIKFGFDVSGAGSIGGQTAQFRRESAVTRAPLPVFGLRTLWQFQPRWYLDGQYQYFSLKANGYDGALTDSRIGVTKMFGKEHFGIGAGWNRFTTSLGIDKGNFDGRLKWRYSGAQIYMTASY
jgi:hypothetical protein